MASLNSNISKTAQPEVALAVEETMRRTGMGRSTLYRAVREGRLTARKLGRRTVFLESEIARFLATLPKLARAQTGGR